MKSRLLASLFASAALVSAFPAAAQLSIRDDMNRALILKQPAKRVVTLAPFLTEMLFAAGAGDLAVGVDEHSDYPPEVLAVPKLATGAGLSLDRIAKLKPDLVLAWRDGIKREVVEAMTAHGTSVYVASARQLEDVPRLLLTIAQLTGRDATQAASDFESKIDKLRRDNANKPRLTAFMEIWNRPLTTVSGEHFLTEALGICKAENVFSDRTGIAPKVSWEDLLAKDPQVIISAGSASTAREFRSNWQMRSSMGAVKGQRMLFIADETISRPTPRTPEGIAKLCAELDNVRAGKVQRAMLDAAAPVGPAGARPPGLGLGPMMPSLANPTGTYPLGPTPSRPSTAAAPAPAPAPAPSPAPAAGAPAAESTPSAPTPAAAPDTQPKRPSQYGD